MNFEYPAKEFHSKYFFTNHNDEEGMEDPLNSGISSWLATRYGRMITDKGTTEVQINS